MYYTNILILFSIISHIFWMRFRIYSTHSSSYATIWILFAAHKIDLVLLIINIIIPRRWFCTYWKPLSDARRIYKLLPVANSENKYRRVENKQTFTYIIILINKLYDCILIIGRDQLPLGVKFYKITFSIIFYNK